MILKHMETFSYCDGVQLFKASSSTGGYYVCVLVEQTARADTFLCVQVTENALELFEKGKSDLLSLYQASDIDDFYVIETGNLYLAQKPALIKRGDVPDDWFPGPG